jgi:serine protease Do
MNKNLISFIGAGAIGGLITLGGLQLISKNTNNDANGKNAFAKFASNTNVPAGAGSVDLSVSAAAATPSVVYIEASESASRAQQRQQEEPMADFFGFSFRQPLKKGTGSGVIVSTDGFIVTNNHVVDFADEVTVTLSDERKYKARVQGTDPRTDLAVLKIDATDLPAIRKGNSDDLKIGEWVLAIGNPFSLRTTVTAGIVSAKGKKLGINETQDAIESFIQTDAVVNPGNSGGALVDAQGRLVGINSAIQTHTGSYEGYSFAIPVNLMSKIVDDLIKNKSVSRPYLGIAMIQDQDFAAAAKERGITANTGVIVAEVKNDGSAQFAGVLPNDVIVGINSNTIRNSGDLKAQIASLKVGETALLTLIRKGRQEQISVPLKEVPRFKTR